MGILSLASGSNFSAMSTREFMPSSTSSDNPSLTVISSRLSLLNTVLLNLYLVSRFLRRLAQACGFPTTTVVAFESGNDKRFDS